MVISSSDGWEIRTLIDVSDSKRGGSLPDQLRSSLGLDQESFEILVIGVALAVLILGIVTLVGLSAQGVRWVGRRNSIDKDASVMMEDDVVDLVDETDLSIGSDEVEIVDDMNSEEIIESGRDSRKARRDRRGSENMDLIDLKNPLTNDSGLEIPSPTMDPLAGPFGEQVSCFECGSRFVTEPGITSMKCPICSSKIEL